MSAQDVVPLPKKKNYIFILLYFRCKFKGFRKIFYTFFVNPIFHETVILHNAHLLKTLLKVCLIKFSG